MNKLQQFRKLEEFMELGLGHLSDVEYEMDENPLTTEQIDRLDEAMGEITSILEEVQDQIFMIEEEEER